MEALPGMDDVNRMSDEQAIATLRVLFEAAPVLERHVLSLRPWASYAAVIDAADAFVQQLLRDDRDDDVLSVLNAHPKIGADPAKLSADSRVEQGAAGDPRVLERLAQLNAEYESKFGFRFVVFVNGRPKDVILGVLEQRMRDNSRRQEMELASRAMMDIARDRLRKRTQQNRL